MQTILNDSGRVLNGNLLSLAETDLHDMYIVHNHLVHGREKMRLASTIATVECCIIFV